MTKASEGIFDDSVVYVTRQGSQVGVDGGRIIVYMKGEGGAGIISHGPGGHHQHLWQRHFTSAFRCQGQ